MHPIFKKMRTDETLIMGILNVTPDSFSDGGLYFSHKNAIKHATEMVAEGTDIIDVGGESTRPGSLSISSAEEIKRTIPIIKEIYKKFGDKILISIDTNKAEVAKAALDAGASMVNSLGGFKFDPNLADVVAQAGCPIIIYHIKGEPRTMQQGEIKYVNVVNDINSFFKNQINFGKKQGIKIKQFILDPGIGFGKSIEHNLTIIKNYRKFSKFKLPTVVGVSRKSHLGKIIQDKLKLKNTPPPTDRLEAGLAETAVAVLNGAKIVRTHDVGQTKKFSILLDLLK